MKKYIKKILSILIILIGILSIQISVYSHSGRTDANGGHKDNKNKSGLGSYHYHCGGHPAHLHPNGVCPYSSSGKSTTSGSSSGSSSSSSSSATKTTTAIPTTIAVTEIQIDKKVEDMEVGDNEKLTAIITPSNATDQNITWKSSDESIATVDSTGKVIAKKPGTVDISATTSNGKSNTITINIKEPIDVQNNYTMNSLMERNNTVTNDVVENINDNEEGSSTLGGIVTLAILGGGGYWGYKKYKNKKENG